MADPLNMSGLDATMIQEAVSKRSKKSETEESKMRAQTNAQREERLQSGPKSKVVDSAPPPPPPPVEPVKDRSSLLDKVGQYKEHFPDLKTRNKIGGKSSVEEIEDELHFYEQQLGTKDGNMATQLLIAVMAGVEHIAEHHYNPLGLQLQGLTKVSKDNELEFKPILDEIIIKYGANMYVSPEMRLCGLVATMMYTVHSANSGDPRMAEAMAKMGSKAKAGPSDL